MRDAADDLAELLQIEPGRHLLGKGGDDLLAAHAVQRLERL
jgi:hypothetical protein